MTAANGTPALCPMDGAPLASMYHRANQPRVYEHRDGVSHPDATAHLATDPNPNHLRGPAGSATPMDYNVKSRYRAAAFHAKRVWPGPVGELVSRELLAVEDFGYLGSHPASEALVADVLAREVAR